MHACLKINLSISEFLKIIIQPKKYYYNENAVVKNGVCKCPKFCNGQGDGSDIGLCKRITIAIFQTGSIIITGARTQRQLDEAYEFINKILMKHSRDVIKPFAQK